MTATTYDPHSLQERALAIVRPPAPEIPEPPPLDGWPVMGTDAWYGLAGDIVTEFADYSEADPVAILLSTLVAFGSAVGSNAGMTADGAHHPARLFACIVGRSAKARKGTSWRNVRNIFQIADPGWTRTRVKSGLSSGEGLIATVADPSLNDDGDPIPGTGCEDKRLLIIEEEFARVLQVAKRESSTLSAIIRQAYDTGDLSVLTKAPLTASGAHICTLGHITSEELRSRLSETETANGFANRFLYALVRRGRLLPDSPQVPTVTMNALATRLNKALQAARNVRNLTRDPEAQRLWSVMYQKMATDEPVGLLGALTARPEAHTLRLSVVYALLDGTDTITVDHLKAAWAVWSYSRQSAEIIFEDAGGGTVERKLYQAIKAAGIAGMSLTEQRDLFNRNMPGSKLEEMRLGLEAAERIRTYPEPTEKGRPTQRSWAVEFDPHAA